MSSFFWMLITFLGRAVCSLRYSIEVRGLEKLSPKTLNRKGGILFMPNHPAHVDPLFNFFLLWSKYRMRPLVVEYVYNLPFLRFWLRLIDALAMPNFETAVNEWKVRKGERSIQEIAEGLKKGKNFLLYPAGQLKSKGKELLGGASGTHELLKECPDVNVVLIRTTGLWGSSFSRALIGRSPSIAKMLIHGFKVLLKNLIFFTPRRRILIEFEPNPQDLPRGDVSRIELNRYLENWYNRYPDKEGNIHESEPVSLVSYSRWRKEIPEVFKPKERENRNNGVHISDETRKKIYNQIQKILEKPDLEIREEMSLSFDLGMDSLNIAEFITYLTKNFDVGELHPEDLETIGSILELAEGGKEGRTSTREPVDFTFPKEPLRFAPALPYGRTIPEAFLNSCQRMNGYSACGDDLLGVLSYKKMKKSALVLAQYFKTWEEERVAVMLPASAGAYIVILALQFARKTPVMINWTLGPRYIEEMMRISNASRIVSSGKFLDRLANVHFGKALDQFVLLEDIRKDLSLKMKLRGVFLSKCSVNCVLKAMRLNEIDENSPCVVLFTSGTEAAPKGVPLSHKNIIYNLRGAMMCIKWLADDALYAILPPFHSFGFSVAGLFPLLAGIKMAFYPDPTDSFALAEGIHRWKISLFCSAPSFLKGLFNAAKTEELRSVRYFISGAEKARQELFDKVNSLGTGAKLLEGYGITECSPILAMNRANLPPRGVGRILSDVELITIHPETAQLLAKGSDGEICVRGPNIFNGYLGNPRTPFIEIEGKKWYRTGDLGHIEADGTLILSGRLKRFIKIGGEMISLGAVEEVLFTELLKSGRISKDIPSVAVCAVEKEEGRPSLILFTTIQIDKEEANQVLLQAGLSNIVKISEVKKIDEIPLMGAGKTDYRTLQALC